MFGFLSYVFGLWVGANMLACPVAHGLLYLLTGKLPVPGKGAQHLRDADQVAAYLRAQAQRALEQHHE